MHTELSVPTANPSRHDSVDRVRVMHLVHGFRPGGMEFGVLKIVNALAGSGVSSSICSTVASQGMKHLVDPSVPIYEFDRREGNDPRVVWWLYRLLRRERPDILHTHAWGTLYEGLIAGRLAGSHDVRHGRRLVGLRRRRRRCLDNPHAAFGLGDLELRYPGLGDQIDQCLEFAQIHFLSLLLFMPGCIRSACPPPAGYRAAASPLGAAPAGAAFAGERKRGGWTIETVSVSWLA